MFKEYQLNFISFKCNLNLSLKIVERKAFYPFSIKNIDTHGQKIFV